MSKKYNIDLHVHSRFSADSVAEPEEIIAKAKKKGLHGFAITDHNTSECVDYFISEGHMRQDGQPVDGFLIIPGQEITTADGHLLALGVSLPNLKGIRSGEAIKIIHEKGGIAIPPHPYDFFRAGIREPVLDTLPLDGLEVFNSATTLKHYNKLAYNYARKRGLAMTAASDAHHPDAVGTAYTILAMKELSVRNVLEAVKQGGELNQKYLSPAEAFKKTWSNWVRLKRPPVKKMHRDAKTVPKIKKV